MKIPEHERFYFVFPALVEESFSFLSTFDFKLLKFSAMLVQYQKDDIQLSVYLERYHEVDLSITWRHERYGLSDFIAIADTKAAKEYQSFMTHNREGLRHGLTQLAELMQHYCEGVLRGDTEYLQMAEEKRKERIEKYWIEASSKHLRDQAYEAFQSCRYQKAAELYKQIQPELSPAEQKRLTIAEKRR